MTSRPWRCAVKFHISFVLLLFCCAVNTLCVYLDLKCIAVVVVFSFFFSGHSVEKHPYIFTDTSFLQQHERGSRGQGSCEGDLEYIRIVSLQEGNYRCRNISSFVYHLFFSSPPPPAVHTTVSVGVHSADIYILISYHIHKCDTPKIFRLILPMLCSSFLL